MQRSHLSIRPALSVCTCQSDSPIRTASAQLTIPAKSVMLPAEIDHETMSHPCQAGMSSGLMKISRLLPKLLLRCSASWADGVLWLSRTSYPHSWPERSGASSTAKVGRIVAKGGLARSVPKVSSISLTQCLAGFARLRRVNLGFLPGRGWPSWAKDL